MSNTSPTVKLLYENLDWEQGREGVWPGSTKSPLGPCPTQGLHLQRGHASRPARDAFRVARVQHGRDRRAAAVYKSLSGDKAAASLGGSAVWSLIRSGVDGVTQADVATARS